MQIKPIQNRVVVRPDLSDVEKQAKAAGLTLPEKNNQRSMQGTVVFAGKGKIDDKGNRVPMDISVGDTVIYHLNFTSKITLGGEEFIVVKEEYCLIAINEGEEIQ